MTVGKRICKWNDDRNNSGFNKVNEFEMLLEELNEMVGSNGDNEIVDALCDIIVVATGGLHKLGYNPDIAMDETIKEISSRQQDPEQFVDWKLNGVSGKWMKWKEQPIDTLYKADYTKAKY